MAYKPLPFIQSMPLSQEAKLLFTEAVELIRVNATAFLPVGQWLREHFSEPAMRIRCQSQWRDHFVSRLISLEADEDAYRRRQAMRNGASKDEITRSWVRYAQLRGYRTNRITIIQPPDTTVRPQLAEINESNIELLWKWEDEQCRQRLHRICEEYKQSEWDSRDDPLNQVWRLREAARRLVEVRYPDDRPTEHAKQSLKIVGIAAIVINPDPMPTFGEFGQWQWNSTVDDSTEPTGDGFVDGLRSLSQAAAKDPLGYRPTLLDSRIRGRNEVLFCTQPGERVEIDNAFPLDEFLMLLKVAVEDELPIKDLSLSIGTLGSITSDSLVAPPAPADLSNLSGLVHAPIEPPAPFWSPLVMAVPIEQPSGSPVNSGTPLSGAEVTIQLEDRHLECLQALFEMKAKDAATRVSIQKAAEKIAGIGADGEKFKRSFADLSRQGLTMSIRGQLGGVWITAKGISLLTNSRSI